MRNLISAFPDVGIAEFERWLNEALLARGLEVIERRDFPRGEVFPALSGRLDRHPAAVAFTFFEPAPVGAAAPTTVLHQLGATGDQWDVPLVRRLSGSVGGFSLTMLADRQREEYGLGVFYAGSPVEAVAWQGGQATSRWAVAPEAQPLDEASTWQMFAAHCRAVGDAHESDLRWSHAVDVRCWVVQGPAELGHAPRLDPADLAGSRLHRAAFINVGATHLQTALAGSGVADSIRILERIAPITRAPYTLLDGEFDDAWFTALAWKLNAQALAFDLGGPDGEFAWCEVSIDRHVHAGVDRGAAALANRIGALTIQLGEPPSIVRWPASGRD